MMAGCVCPSREEEEEKKDCDIITDHTEADAAASDRGNSVSSSKYDCRVEFSTSPEPCEADGGVDNDCCYVGQPPSRLVFDGAGGWYRTGPITMHPLLRALCHPEHKGMTNAARRLDTFTNWPKQLMQTPEELAAKGIYIISCQLEEYGYGAANYAVINQGVEETAQTMNGIFGTLTLAAVIHIGKGEDVYVKKLYDENNAPLRGGHYSHLSGHLLRVD